MHRFSFRDDLTRNGHSLIQSSNTQQNTSIPPLKCDVIFICFHPHEIKFHHFLMSQKKLVGKSKDLRIAATANCCFALSNRVEC